MRARLAITQRFLSSKVQTATPHDDDSSPHLDPASHAVSATSAAHVLGRSRCSPNRLSPIDLQSKANRTVTVATAASTSELANASSAVSPITRYSRSSPGDRGYLPKSQPYGGWAAQTLLANLDAFR